MLTQLLGRFAALSMIGTLLLSVLPAGGMKRTAAFAVGLLTLMCWAESIAALLGTQLTHSFPDTVLMTTAVSVEQASADAAASLCSRLEDGQ